MLGTDQGPAAGQVKQRAERELESPAEAGSTAVQTVGGFAVLKVQ